MLEVLNGDNYIKLESEDQRNLLVLAGVATGALAAVTVNWLQNIELGNQHFILEDEASAIAELIRYLPELSGANHGPTD